MSEIIEQRLKKYQLINADQELNALKEIAQELILCALSEVNFFDKAFFLGGTSLRIVHGIRRFSEDLDFSLLKQENNFNFDLYIESVQKILLQFGLDMEVGKKSDDKFIKSRQLKNDSLKKKITFPIDRKLKKIVIKLELDTNPPQGGQREEIFLDFPRYHRVLNADLPSIFAGKINAILTRTFTKGRDWYDLLWLLSRDVVPNYQLLSNSLAQFKRVKQGEVVDKNFVLKSLTKKIEEVDWKKIQEEMMKFVQVEEVNSLKLWNERFFTQIITKKMNLSFAKYS